MPSPYPVNEATVLEALRRLTDNIAAVASSLKDGGESHGHRLQTYVEGLRRAINALERRR